MINVLIVEDDEMNQIVIKDMFELAFSELNIDYNIDMASDGLEALNLVKAKQYDIILTDIDMPKMNGIELLENIKNMGIKTPVIAITAYGLTGDREKFLSYGFDDYIAKPIDFETLKGKVAKYV